MRNVYECSVMLGQKDSTPRATLTVLLSEDAKQEVEALTHLVLTLLMEVESLRAAVLEDDRTTLASLKDSSYARAYRETALLTHNSAGPSTGIEKLLEHWV